MQLPVTVQILLSFYKSITLMLRPKILVCHHFHIFDFFTLLFHAFANSFLDGVSCLQLACHHGNLEIMKLIIEAKGRVDILNNEDETPLFYAVAGNHPAVVRALLTAKANVNHLNCRKESPLHWAVQDQHVEVIKVLKVFSFIFPLLIGRS